MAAVVEEVALAIYVDTFVWHAARTVRLANELDDLASSKIYLTLTCAYSSVARDCR